MRTFTFADIAAYKSAKASGGSIYAALIGDANLKSGAVVSKITATGDVLIDAMNPFVTPNLATNEDILYYSSTEGYRSLRKGKTTWDANSLGQIYIDTSRLPSGFAVVAEYNDIFSFKAMTQETTGSGRSKMTSIRGNSVARNQYVIDGDFPSLTNWTYISSSSHSVSVSNGFAHLTGSANFYSNNLKSATFQIVSGHKYFVSCSVKGTIGSRVISLEQSNNVGLPTSLPSSATGFTKVSAVVTATVSGNANIMFFGTQNVSTAYDFYITSVCCVDLTLLYGTAIDGMTDAQILAKFEAEFGTGYFDQEDGRILSNAASAMEVTGFNQWDEEWELKLFTAQHTWDYNTARVSSKNPIQVFPNTLYYIQKPSGSEVIFYDEQKKYISYVSKVENNGESFTTPSNCRYVMFQLHGGYGTTTYNHDICINLSDPSKNGTYEPYKKVIVPLDVTKIRVKSPNIWDEEWDVGYIDGTTGQNDNNYPRVRSKNYIPIIPSTAYYGRTPTGVPMAIRFYDANKNYLGSNYSMNITPTSGNPFTTPANAYYMRFFVGTEYGTFTYANDICINKSDPGFNGKYFPHGSFCPFPDGLRSAGSVYDEIVGNKVIRRVGRISLGSLTWTKYESYHAFNSTEISDAKGGTAGVMSNITCSKYRTSTANGISAIPENAIAFNMSRKELNVVDSSYDSYNATQFKTAMADVYANYELATPEVFELDYPLTPIIYPAKGGTKRILPVNGSSPVTAPFSCMVQPI